MRYFKTVAFLLLSLWAVLLMYLSMIGLSSPRNTGEYEEISKAIQALQQRVEEGSKNLKITIERLELLPNGEPVAPTKSVDLSHEILRNRAINFARELFFAATAGLDEIKKTLSAPNNKDPQSAIAPIDSLRLRLEEMTRYLEIDLDGLGRVDHLAELRRKELDRLGERVQRRIEQLQNPSDCSKANLLHVGLTRPCAFGCNVHHLAYCLQLAYATGRTLVLTDTQSSYGEWWSKNFLPLSKTCSNVDDPSPAETMLGKNTVSSPRVVQCPYIGQLSGTDWLPPAVPADLAPELKRLHAAPAVWFMGQILTYLMRPAPEFARILNETLTSYGLSSPRKTPVAGLHVRRTDKINTEAAFHGVREYMTYVERRFQFWDAQQQMINRQEEWVDDAQPKYHSTNPRQIFIATDDPSVFEDARKEYPNYIFYGDTKRAQSASVETRTHADSITGVALDILVLSKVDYIVCTFSSQVCRVSYELMQARHGELGDASGLAQSLDDTYYFGGQQPAPQEVIIEDKESGLKVGDRIHVAGNHWNGYARVVDIPGHPDALVPAYKYRPRVVAVPMGNFVD